MIEGVKSRVNSKSLEETTRAFLKNCLSSGCKKGESDHFATLEIKSLLLLKKVKAKISEDDVNAEKDKTESDGKDSQKKTVKKVKKAKIVDPFKNLQKKSYDCPYCDKTYDASSIKSLQFHCRKHHEDKPKLSKKDFDEEIEVECELITKKGRRCGNSFPRHQLRRHLERLKIHKKPQQKPKDKVFRAWRFVGDDVEVKWTTSPDEEIPSEEEVEVEEDMLVEEAETSGNEDVPDQNKNVPVSSMDSAEDDKSEVSQDAGSVGVEPEPEKGQTKSRVVEKTNNEPEEAVEEINDKETETNSGSETKTMVPNGQLISDEVITELPDQDEPMSYEDGYQNILLTTEKQKSEIRETGDMEEETFTLTVSADGQVTTAEEIITPMETGLSTDPQLVNYEESSSYLETEQESMIVVNPNFVQSKESDGHGVVEYVVSPPVPVCYLNSDKCLSSVCQDATAEVEISALKEAMIVPESNVEVEVQSNNALGISLQSTGIDELMKYSMTGEIESQEALMMYQHEEEISGHQEVGPHSGSPGRAVGDGLQMDEGVENKVENLNESKIDDDGLNQVITSTSQETVYEEQEAGSFTTVKDKFLDEDRKMVRFLIDEEVWSCEDQKLQDLKSTKDDKTLSDSEESDASIDSEYDEDLDSDIIITKKRQERKKVRLMNRNNIEASTDPSEIKENQGFIKDLERWLTNKTSLQTTNPKPANIASKLGHVVYHHDSFVNYMTGKNAQFNLNRLIDFKNKDNFLAIESPIGWISSAAGPDKIFQAKSGTVQNLAELGFVVHFKTFQAKFCTMQDLTLEYILNLSKQSSAQCRTSL